MSNILLKRMQKIHADESLGGEEKGFMHRTGLIPLDYLNASFTLNDNDEKVIRAGIQAGKSILAIGAAGSGKSTLLYQVSSEITKRYADAGSTIDLYDFEVAAEPERFMSVCGMTRQFYKDHVQLRNKGIYTETILKAIGEIRDAKLELKEDILIDDREGNLDDDGNPMRILPPTFIIIDSIAAMRTQDFHLADKMNGLTSGGRNAIMNKELFVRSLQPCIEANIILMQVNHISTNMSMGVTPPTASSRFLKNTQAVSGGGAIQYFANLWIEVIAGDIINDIPGDKKNLYGGEIKGFKSLIKIIKSRNAEAGHSTMLVFDQRSGYDNELSCLEVLLAEEAILGNPRAYFIPGREDIKFKRNNFKEILRNNPDFKEDFLKFAEEYMQGRLKGSRKLVGKTVEEVFAEEYYSEEVQELVAARDKETEAKNEQYEIERTKEIEDIIKAAELDPSKKEDSLFKGELKE